jgi:hypothetical protein
VDKPARVVIRRPELLPPPAPLVETASVSAPPSKAEPFALVFQRRDRRKADELAGMLRQAAREIDLDKVAETSAKLLAHRGVTVPGKAETALDIVGARPDLAGLPVRREPDCRLSTETAHLRENYSRALRTALSHLSKQDEIRSREASLGHMEYELRERRWEVLRSPRGQTEVVLPGEWRTGAAVVPLVQILQGEDRLVRVLLVRQLFQIQDPAAAAALARLALFDLADDVRELAVYALPGRPRTYYRQILLDGLRYPWAPVADHAAEALVTLSDREAIPSLVDLLDKPDPSAAVFNADHKLAVPELVCVNHLRNCALCHAPSHDREDPIRGAVPIPGKPLPIGLEYYAGGTRVQFVRADVTYLKQDFSAAQPVRDHGVWPEKQRHDYLIRLRELTAPELARLRNAPKPEAGRVASYPQREAVLFALRKLSGRDAGTSAADWRKALAQVKLQEGR